MIQSDKKEKWTLLALTAVILWTMFIWGNSMIPGPKSMHASQQVAASVSPFLDFLNLTAKQWNAIVRKAGHMTEFGILGIFWCWFLSLRMTHSWKLPAISLGICFATGSIDETIQKFTGRTSVFRDVCFDTAGGFLGICLLIGIGAWVVHHKKKAADQKSGS